MTTAKHQRSTIWAWDSDFLRPKAFSLIFGPEASRKKELGQQTLFKSDFLKPLLIGRQTTIFSKIF